MYSFLVGLASTELPNGFGTSPDTYIVPSYSIVKYIMQIIYHATFLAGVLVTTVTTIVEPTSVTTMEMENTTVVPAAAPAPDNYSDRSSGISANGEWRRNCSTRIQASPAAGPV